MAFFVDAQKGRDDQQSIFLVAMFLKDQFRMLLSDIPNS